LSNTASGRGRGYRPTLRWIAAPLVVVATALALVPSAVDAGTLVQLAQAKPVSADDAAATVRAQVGGRILDVRLRSKARRKVWRVKVLLPGGRVRVYRVDARTGRILG